MTNQPVALYAEHLQRRQEYTERVLEETCYDALVLHSGSEQHYFADDQSVPFRSGAHFGHWLPLPGPGHWLVVRPGRKPRLIQFSPEDYWYEPLAVETPFWAAHMDCVEVGDVESLYAELPELAGFAFVGADVSLALERGFAKRTVNDPALVARLDWGRSYKSNYEVACIVEATRRAAPAHLAARDAFLNGASELDIHHAYVAALGATDKELPYESIVALDEKGAYLHYLGKRRQRDGAVLLIDAGASHLGYACDITRTWAHARADGVFRDLVSGMDRLQRSLCDEVRDGMRFADLHHRAHVLIGELLCAAGVLRIGGETAVERGLTRAFFPHGLGHFLGLQVHDVAGHQRSPAGGREPPPPLHANLRTTRTLEPGHVLTVEPGLYFIEMLLGPLRAGAQQHEVDWPLVERLKPFGGIRIEDDVALTPQGVRNLTREWLNSVVT